MFGIFCQIFCCCPGEVSRDGARKPAGNTDEPDEDHQRHVPTQQQGQKITYLSRKNTHSKRKFDILDLNQRLT